MSWGFFNPLVYYTTLQLYLYLRQIFIMFVSLISPRFVAEKNTNIKIIVMNKNLTGVLYTAAAVVVGIVAATMIQKRLMAKKATAVSEDEA